MGQPMARNLLKAGYDLVVHNRTASKAASLTADGALLARSPMDVANRTDVVVTMLPDSTDVADVVSGPNGILRGARPGLTWIDMSTIAPAVCRDLAQRCAANGIDSLDAPVSGGPVGAAAGTLSIMVGGPQTVFDRCLPLLTCLGKTIVLTGDSGAGQVTKACNQIVIAGTLNAISEALVLGAKAGVRVDRIREALLGGFAASPLLEVHGERMIKHSFDPGFFVRLFRKDLRIALELASQLSVWAPTAAATVQVLNSLIAHGDEDSDISAMITVYERLSEARVSRND